MNPVLVSFLKRHQGKPKRTYIYKKLEKLILPQLPDGPVKNQWLALTHVPGGTPAERVRASYWRKKLVDAYIEADAIEQLPELAAVYDPPCLHCDGKVARRRRDKRFCSDKCRNAYRRALIREGACNTD